MSAASVLAWIFFLGPVFILLGVVALLACLGKMASGSSIRWPWKR